MHVCVPDTGDVQVYSIQVEQSWLSIQNDPLRYRTTILRLATAATAIE